MFLYLIVGLLVTVVVYTSVDPLLAVVTYIALGIGWYRTYWLSKPLVMRSPIGPAAPIGLWPLMCIHHAREMVVLTNHPERFTVAYGDTGKSAIIRDPAHHATFAGWEDALASAKNEAARSGHEVAVYDMATWGVAPITKEPTCATYAISPAGEVKRLY